ncbi:MAG: ABC transporter substrate-binding protein [Phycisphaeraceae bacterium]
MIWDFGFAIWESDGAGDATCRLKITNHKSQITNWLALFCIALLMFGCGRSPNHVATASGRRIVCLSPAITQMLIDLGLSGDIVGGGRFDPVLPKGAAVVGDLRQLDYEKLLAMRPTLILRQPERNDVPDRLPELAKQYGWRVYAWRIDTMEDLYRVLCEGADNMGAVVGREKEAATLAAKVRGRFAALRRATEGMERPRVLLLVGVSSTFTAVGPGTVLDEMLDAAGGVNVMSDAKVTYPVLDREDVLLRRPDVVVTIEGREGATGAIEPTGGLAGLDIPAVKNHRVMQMSDPVALLPSTSGPRVAVKLAKLLHPSQAEAFEHILNGDEQR